MGSNIGLYAGPLFLSCTFAYFFAGCSFIQAVYFFQTTPISRRHAYAVTLVSTVCIVEVVSLAISTIGAYRILCVAIPKGDLSFQFPPVTLGLATLNTFITVCVQAHFALRIRMLSQGRWAGNAIALLIAVLGLAEIGASVGMTYFGVTANRELSRWIHDKQQKRVLMVWFICKALADIVNTLTLVYIYLRLRKNTERRQSKSWLNNLIIHTIENGAVTSVAAVLHFGFFIGLPNSPMHLAMAHIAVRLYANVLFASINANRRLQQDATTHSDSSSGSHSDPSTGEGALGAAIPRIGSIASSRGPGTLEAIRQGGLIGTRTETIEFTRIESSVLSGSGDTGSGDTSSRVRGVDGHWGQEAPMKP